jgi:hypothetical protein
MWIVLRGAKAAGLCGRNRLARGLDRLGLPTPSRRRAAGAREYRRRFASGSSGVWMSVRHNESYRFISWRVWRVAWPLLAIGVALQIAFCLARGPS